MTPLPFHPQDSILFEAQPHEVAVALDPINDLAAMIEAFNCGDANRARALEFAEREGRRFDNRSTK